jgi:hypothetical protein
MVAAASCYGYDCHWQGLGSFWGDKNKQNRAKHIQILEENLVQSAFQQTPGYKFTFQKDNNLKHTLESKYTLEYLIMTTLNVPEWPSYSFDLNKL